MTRSFSSDYLAGADAALPFLPLDFRREEHRRRAVQQAARASPELVTALREAHRGLPPSEGRQRNLDRLADGAACVVTGQQVGLFGGPLYTVHKTLSAVATARALEDLTGRPVVPVFWVQCEDHDFAEIACVGVPRPTGEVREIGVECPGDDRAPVAHRPLGPSVEAALEAMAGELHGLPHASDVVAELRGHYRPERTIAEAFSALIGDLFAGHGVVLFDPRHPALAGLGAPLHRQAIEQAESLADRLTDRAEALGEAGYDVQVHVRPGAPLAFYHPDEPTGPRFRLERAAGGYTLVGDGRAVTRQALLQALEEDPRRLSTSALLRPALQDSLLPTAAYVGGPGELNYFAQLPPLYEGLGQSMPMFVPRARFQVLDRRTASALEELGLSPHDLTRPRPDLVARAGEACAAGHAEPESIQDRLLSQIMAELGSFEAVASKLDPGLVKAVRRTGDQVRQGVEKLVAKYARALAQRDEATLSRLDRARGLVAPGGAPQERVYGLPWFAARFGTADLLAALERALVPFDPTLKDVLV